jgi:hypothetical protein
MLVSDRDAVGALTLNTLCFQIASTIGPVIAGVLLLRFDGGVTYAVAGATTLGVIVVGTTAPNRPVADVDDRRVVGASHRRLAEALEAIRFVRSSPVLFGLMAIDFAAMLFGTCSTLLPLVAEEILRVGPRELGLLYAAPAFGSLAAGLVFGTVRTPTYPGRVLLAAVTTYGLCVFGFGLSSSFILSMALLAGSGAADAASSALRLAIRTLSTPDALRGRVAATHSIVAIGGPQLGETKNGLVAAMTGAGPAIAVGGLCALVATAAIAHLCPAIGRFTNPDAAPLPWRTTKVVGSHPVPTG